MFDLRKAALNAKDKHFSPPVRDLRVNLSLPELLSEMDKILLHKPLIAVDIEGGVRSFSCISIAPSASFSFIVPFTTMSGDNLYDHLDDECAVWRKLAQILSDPSIPKVLQNSLYDRFVLQYSHSLVIRGVVDDTMLKHWELYCELEKSLGFQASIYTDEPYYKSDRKNPDREVFWQYCCRDSAVTYEINSKLDAWLSGSRREHYNFNVSLLNPILYMELRGIRYNTARAAERLAEVNHHIYTLQQQLDRLAGVGIPPGLTKEKLLLLAQEKLCYKRNPTQPKKGCDEDFEAIRQMVYKAGPLTDVEIGHAAVVLGLSMNIKSPAFKTFLYEKLALPKQYKADPVSGEMRLSADYEALLKLWKKTESRAVQLALEIGMLRTRAQMLAISSDNDGRVRCGYNVVGTETGRLTCYTSPTGSGYNLQTIPSGDPLQPEGHPLRHGMRDLFTADPGFHLFQCDLSGADGWTVAAHLAALGDPTMLDDYRSGVKPAKVLCYMLRHGADSLRGKTREEIKALTKPISSKDWDYFACKIGQHGTSYLMGPIKLANTIFIQSEGKVILSSTEAGNLQKLFTVRYRVKLWHEWMQRHLAKRPELTSASGYVRRFFGRAKEILGQALAHEPQANTTYATNLAAMQLWSDPENRTPTGALRIEPLHQVHDALVGQFRIEVTEWAVVKIKSYFHNPIRIANQTIIIPFEGNYGSSWGNLEYEIK
jgi:DNA polymerase I-like protein with 3'-5' exonuclease and polymerase domains